MKQILTFIILLFTLFLHATIRNVPDPYETIQAGINATDNGDTVLVQPGTYYENINYWQNLITVGSLFLTTQDTAYISSTILDGGGESSSSVVTFTNGEDSTTVLCGFTITNNLNINNGGGIYCDSYSNPSLKDLVISGNSSPLGGGIYCDNSSPSLYNVTISGNPAEFYGGGIYCDNSSPSLYNVTISDNPADIYGGGIYCYDSDLSLENVTITGNSAFRGGGIWCSASSPSLQNVIISDNSASNAGGGIYCENVSSPSLINSILWNDSPQEVYIASYSITVTYSDIEGGWTGTGNIDSDPIFVDPGGGDYNLQSGSPCINTGDVNSTVPVGGGSCIDMGTNEYIADNQVSVNGIDNTFTDNEIEGVSCAFAAQSGTVDVLAQQFLSDPPNTQGEDDIGRYWELEAAGSAYIRLFFNVDENAMITSPKIFQYFSGAWNELASSAVGTQGSSYYLDSISPISNWGSRATSLFTVGEEDSPLPVHLSAFYALYLDGTPTLYWTTQSENNNAYWNVYRGTSSNFEDAIHLNNNSPVPGNGTTNTPSDYIYIDTAPVIQNTTYWYWIEDVSTDGESQVHDPITLEIPFEDTPISPDYYGLHQNYPNPFNPNTSISFLLQEESDVVLAIYNIKGERVRKIFNDHVSADQIQIVIWDGNDTAGKRVSSGVYFYKLITDTKEETRKMLMVK